MDEASDAQEFERAATLPRPAERRALADGAPARRGRGHRHRRPDRGRRRRRRRQRADLPGPRRRARRAPELLSRQRGRARRGRGHRGVHRPVLLGGAVRCRRWSSSALRSRASTELLAEALGQRRGAPVEVRVAERGDKRRLRELAERNAQLALGQDQLRRERSRQQRVDALAALQAELGLAELPLRIEGFDISNLGPDHTVASMVVFEGGAPKKSDYRRFGIRGVKRARRLRLDRGGALAADRPLPRPGGPLAARRDSTRRLLRRPAEPDRDRRRQGPARGRACGPLAPLIERAREQGREVAVIGLAKRLEEIYLPGAPRPLPIRAWTRRPCGCCSGSATRRIASRSTSIAGAAARR